MWAPLPEKPRSMMPAENASGNSCLKITELCRPEDPRTSTLTADELERMESLAKDIQEAPDQRTFIQAVAELKNFLSTRAEKL